MPCTARRSSSTADRIPSRSSRLPPLRSRSMRSSSCWTIAAMCRTSNSQNSCSLLFVDFSLRAMVPFGPVTHTPLSTIRVDDRDVRVTLHTAHDGIELVGRLFFAEQGWENSGIPDRGVLWLRQQRPAPRRARAAVPSRQRRVASFSWAASAHPRATGEDPLPESGGGEREDGAAGPAGGESGDGSDGGADGRAR